MLNKKVIANIEKCYCVAKLRYKGSDHLLVAAEKKNECLMFSPRGEVEEKLWDGPGGVMTMEQLPESDGVFLTTQMFYSPNDSKEARIACVTPRGKNDWEIKTIANLPFVHRFGILRSDGGNYLIACTLKSAHEFKDDWRSDGKVFAAKLEDVEKYGEDNPIPLVEIASGFHKNHGFFKFERNGKCGVLIGSESGIFEFCPPTLREDKWQITKLSDEKASDVLLCDLDGDGEDELLVLAPFHGDTIKILKKRNGVYATEFEFSEKFPFLHAICALNENGKRSAVIGNREGARNLMKIFFENGSYRYTVLDEDSGSANVLTYTFEGKNYLLAANREKSEVALYALGV